MSQQTEALRLADALHAESESSIKAVKYSTAKKSAAELRRQHAEIARLTAENEALRSAVSEAVAAEREECARICDELQTVPATEPRHCAADIRARGTP